MAQCIQVFSNTEKAILCESAKRQLMTHFRIQLNLGMLKRYSVDGAKYDDVADALVKLYYEDDTEGIEGSHSPQRATKNRYSQYLNNARLTKKEKDTMESIMSKIRFEHIQSKLQTADAEYHKTRYIQTYFTLKSLVCSIIGIASLAKLQELKTLTSTQHVKLLTSCFILSAGMTLISGLIKINQISNHPELIKSQDTKDITILSLCWKAVVFTLYLLAGYSVGSQSNFINKMGLYSILFIIVLSEFLMLEHHLNSIFEPQKAIPEIESVVQLHDQTQIQ